MDSSLDIPGTDKEDVEFQSPFPILIGSGSQALLASSPHPQVEVIPLRT